MKLKNIETGKMTDTAKKETPKKMIKDDIKTTITDVKKSKKVE